MLGTILEEILAYERGERDQRIMRTVDPHILQSVYWQSIEWANGVMESIMAHKK